MVVLELEMQALSELVPSAGVLDLRLYLGELRLQFINRPRCISDLLARRLDLVIHSLSSHLRILISTTLDDF